MIEARQFQRKEIAARHLLIMYRTDGWKSSCVKKNLKDFGMAVNEGSLAIGFLKGFNSKYKI